MHSLSKIDAIAVSIFRIDQVIEHLHEEFDPHDREIEPALLELSKARTTLENKEITLRAQGD